jgi:hypothetical protein
MYFVINMYSMLLKTGYSSCAVWVWNVFSYSVEKQRLKIFENSLQERIFRYNTDKRTEKTDKFAHPEISSNILMVIK